MSLTDAITVQPAGEARFHAHVDEQWTALQGVNGGIVAALAVAAVEHVLRDAGVDPATTLRAATFGYVSGNSVGDLTIDVEVIRRGRAMITTHVRTEQGDKTTTLARLHHSTPWVGPEYSDAPPMPTRPAGTVRLQAPPAHVNHLETHLHPDTTLFAGTARAEWIAWSPSAIPAVSSRTVGSGRGPCCATAASSVGPGTNAVAIQG